MSINFKIITNNTGDHLQVLEEFSDPNWSVVLRFGKVLVYNRFKDCLTKEEFIKFKLESEGAIWRNRILKLEKLELYNKILKSLINWERHYKICRVLDNQTNNYLLCC
jgi:hypothetical protein